MMAPVHRINATGANAVNGQLRLDLKKSAWFSGLAIAAVTLIADHTTIEAALFGLTLTYLTLLLGHSVGMHRLMIHRSFSGPKWLERTLIYIGVLVGMGGPSDIIRTHDLRDWAQRQTDCHDAFSHRRGFLRDLTWQLFYRFEFVHPPEITVEGHWADDAFIRHLDRTWRLHQIALGALLFLLGGLPFVVWGIFVRVVISIAGHWTVTYFCHQPGVGRWSVVGAGVQACDLPIQHRFLRAMAGVLTHGECWHSNHHAFPESARVGLYARQADPAAVVIETFDRLGWLTRRGLPRQDIEDLRLRETPLI